MGRERDDRPHGEPRPPTLTLKERAKNARHEAYVAAKERRKNDPRVAEQKARMKAARREAAAQAKERRKTDPKQIALKEKLKDDRQAARRARTAKVKASERPVARPERGPMLELILGGPGRESPSTRSSSLPAARAALIVIDGGRSSKAPKTPPSGR